LSGTSGTGGIYKCLQIGKRPPNPRDYDTSSRCGPDSGSTAFEQRQAELILKIADSSGQCGSIDAELPCGSREAPGLNDRQQ
jgi:hypothetical protein